MRRTLVLVPGLGCTEALFAPQIASLGEDLDIRVADHRQDETVEDIARRLLADAPERFALAGLSMGGYVALAVLRLAPERVSALALLDTNARSDNEDVKARRRTLIALAEQNRLVEIHAALWPKLVHPGRLGDALLEETVRGMLEQAGGQAFAAQERAIMARPDARRDLAGIAVPTLVLVGEEDALTPPEQAEEMAAAIPDATLARVPSCGHLSTLEQPEAVTAAMRAWLSR